MKRDGQRTCGKVWRDMTDDIDMRVTPNMMLTQYSKGELEKKKKKHLQRSPSALHLLTISADKTPFQSGSVAWSGRGAVRNVLNGRSIRRLAGNDCFY